MNDLKHLEWLQSHLDMSKNLSLENNKLQEMAAHSEQVRIGLAMKTLNFLSRAERLMVQAALTERVTHLQKHFPSLLVFHVPP